jgi:hypothetical protein
MQVDKHGRLKIVTPNQDTGYTVGCALRRTSTIGTSGAAPVSWQQEIYDDAGFWSSGTNIVIPAGYAGWYGVSFHAQLDWTSGTAIDYSQVWIQQNGVITAINMGYRGSATAGINQSVHGYLKCADGDVILAYTSQAGSYNITRLSDYSPRIEVVRIGGSL